MYEDLVDGGDPTRLFVVRFLIRLSCAPFGRRVGLNLFFFYDFLVTFHPKSDPTIQKVELSSW